MIQKNDLLKIGLWSLIISLLLTVPSMFVMTSEKGIFSTQIKSFVVIFLVLSSLIISILNSLRIDMTKVWLTYIVSMLFAAIPGITVSLLIMINNRNMPLEPVRNAATGGFTGGNIVGILLLGCIILTIVGIIASFIFTTVIFLFKKRKIREESRRD